MSWQINLNDYNYRLRISYSLFGIDLCLATISIRYSSQFQEPKKCMSTKLSILMIKQWVIILEQTLRIEEE